MDGEPPQITKEVTASQWKALYSASRRGNWKFPQSHFAQKIMVAHRIKGLSEETRTPLVTFCTDIPSRSMQTAIEQEIDESKRIAHAQHGFTTQKEPVDDPSVRQESLFEVDLRSAASFIKQVGELVYDFRHPVSDEYVAPFTKVAVVAEDPLFTSIINATYAAVTSPDADKISEAYKAPIAAFMQKYAPQAGNAVTVPPQQYKDERSQAMREAQEELNKLTGLVGEQVRVVIEENFPDEEEFRQMFTEQQTSKMLDVVNAHVRGMNPLKL